MTTTSPKTQPPTHHSKRERSVCKECLDNRKKKEKGTSLVFFFWQVVLSCPSLHTQHTQHAHTHTHNTLWKEDFLRGIKKNNTHTPESRVGVVGEFFFYLLSVFVAAALLVGLFQRLIVGGDCVRLLGFLGVFGRGKKIERRSTQETRKENESNDTYGCQGLSSNEKRR